MLLLCIVKLAEEEKRNTAFNNLLSAFQEVETEDSEVSKCFQENARGIGELERYCCCIFFEGSPGPEPSECWPKDGVICQRILLWPRPTFLSLLERWRLGTLRKQRSKDQSIHSYSMSIYVIQLFNIFHCKGMAGEKHGPSIPMLPWNPVLPDQGLNHRYESGGLPLPEAASQVVWDFSKRYFTKM